MKPYRSAPDIQPTPPSEAQSFLAELTHFVSRSVTEVPSWDLETDMPNAACSEFFSKYYLKPDNAGVLKQIRFDMATPVSSAEANIINFFTSSDSKNRMGLLIDFAGRGKSTLLKYIALHLTTVEEPSLRNEFQPVYISLRSFEHNLADSQNRFALGQVLDDLIVSTAHHFIYPYILENADSVFKFLNIGFSSTKSLFPESQVEIVTQDPGLYLMNCRKNEPELYSKIFLGALSHYSDTIAPIVLFLDDADNFNTDIQRGLLDYSRKKILSGFRALVSMRQSSWRSMEWTRRDAEYRILPRIYWSVDALKRLLRNRITVANRKIKLLMDQKHIEVETPKIVDSFVDLLRGKGALEFFVKTSNYNLHSLIRKLDLLPKSAHFKDEHIIRESIKEHLHLTTSSKGTPLWIIYHLVFGGENGYFQSDDHLARCGIINCFCTDNKNNEPFTYFIRLNILSSLYQRKDESKAKSVKDIHTELRPIFEYNLDFTSVYIRALFRLIQGSLVLTTSCNRYQDEQSFGELVQNDKIFISDSGIYYLETLINRIEYLTFMKDDIDWLYPLGEEIVPAKPGCNRVKEHKQTLRALKSLMQIECQMVSDIVDRSPDFDGRNLIKLYKEHFSATRLSKAKGSTLLFTERMYRAYSRYFGYINSHYKHNFREELDSINKLRASYRDF